MHKRTTAAAALLGALLLAGCGAGQPAGLRASAGGDEAPLVEVGETTTTTTAGPGPTTTTTVRATTTIGASADLDAAEAARQAKESADEAEESAQRAEEAAQAVTSTTTTTLAPTTTTTAPKVYGWVEVARFEVSGGPDSTPPLVQPVTLAGGKLRVVDDPFGKYFDAAMGEFHRRATMWLGADGPMAGAPADAGNVIEASRTTPDGVWRGDWPAQTSTLTLAWFSSYIDGLTGVPYNGGPAGTVRVEEWQVIG